MPLRRDPHRVVLCHARSTRHHDDVTVCGVHSGLQREQDAPGPSRRDAVVFAAPLPDQRIEVALRADHGYGSRIQCAGGEEDHARQCRSHSHSLLVRRSPHRARIVDAPEA